MYARTHYKNPDWYARNNQLLGHVANTTTEPLYITQCPYLWQTTNMLTNFYTWAHHMLPANAGFFQATNFAANPGFWQTCNIVTAVHKHVQLYTS